MSARMQVELPDGRRLFIGGGGTTTGMGEVSVGGRVAAASAEVFEKGLSTLADLFGMLDSAVSRLPKRPDTIEMEFRAKITGECDLWVVSGEGEAEFTVKVTWGAK
ncbi:MULTISPECIES: CU044_2847 family protein [Roseomonadaceae]|uniref:Trypsin-co-occurring domain-containing protein n=1 Tax=Falsiroseomonas oleicola TaxID=2801474 RepID=A0ABS6H3L7_9PROT|nr:CU044_2847 family protein [Roseomonas oleicola]MBU8543264.1 hypothetical protein [Roseomonas oleicola]